VQRVREVLAKPIIKRVVVVQRELEKERTRQLTFNFENRERKREKERDKSNALDRKTDGQR